MSIIEPVSLNMEISAKRRGHHENGKSPGILDAAPPEYADQTLEVSSCIPKLLDRHSAFVFLRFVGGVPAALQSPLFLQRHENVCEDFT